MLKEITHTFHMIKYYRKVDDRLKKNNADNVDD